MTTTTSMKVTTKSLRTKAREILECVDRGEPVTITYRGKPRAKLVGIDQSADSGNDKKAELPVFGIWEDRGDITDVDALVRRMRKARFDVD